MSTDREQLHRACAALSRWGWGEGLSPEAGFAPRVVPSRRLAPALGYLADALEVLPAQFSPGGPGVRAYLDAAASVPPKNIDEILARLTSAQLIDLYVATSVLVQSYRWNNCPPAKEEFSRRGIVLPRGLVKPWAYCAHALGVPLSNTYFGVIGANWTVDGRDGLPTRAGLDAPSGLLWNWLVSPYYEQLEHFVLAFVDMELLGVAGLKALPHILRGILEDKHEELETGLEQVRESIRAMKRAFNRRIKDRLVPISDWKNIIHIPFAWGLTGPQGIALEGASGMQLGSIAALSAFLGVDQSSPMGAMTTASRAYMLPAQRRYLTLLDQVGPLLQAYLPYSSRSLHSACLDELVAWRVSHRNRGALYLRVPNTLPDAATGLTLDGQGDIVKQFTHHMNDRIQETQEAYMKDPVLEFVKWRSAEGVSDEAMIAAVDAFANDLKSIKGFHHQTLYKQEDGTWLDVYYWQTEEDAIASNDAAAGLSTFQDLIKLIEPDSVGIEILHPLQASGALAVQ